MADNSKLTLQARNLAQQRGHKIGEFLVTQLDTSHIPLDFQECLVGVCEYCGALAAVYLSPPLPGQVAVWGEALERDCPGEVFI